MSFEAVSPPSEPLSKDLTVSSTSLQPEQECGQEKQECDAALSVFKLGEEAGKNDDTERCGGQSCLRPRDSSTFQSSHLLEPDDITSLCGEKDRLLQDSNTPSKSTSHVASSLQDYDLCHGDENICFSRRPLLGDPVTSGSDEGSTSTNSSMMTGSYVTMYHESSYLNFQQRPQEVKHWYRTENGEGDHDEWEVVEVGLDGTVDLLTSEVSQDGDETGYFLRRVVNQSQKNKKKSLSVEGDTGMAGDNFWRVAECGGDDTVLWDIHEQDNLLIRSKSYPLSARANRERDHELERMVERLLWYKLGYLMQKGSVGVKNIKKRVARRTDSGYSDNEDYPSEDEDNVPFGGFDGASESSQAPPRPSHRFHRSARAVHDHSKNRITKITSAAQPPKPKRLPHEREFAKTWLRTRISRARTLPDDLKTNEDRLLEWLNSEMDDDTTVQCDEIVGLTVQMFGLLKPGGAFGGIFAPGGALSAHPGTYLAAQSTLLGIIPAIGMTKANCVNCTKEVGRPGDGVWWRCKGCRMGRGFICGDCFAKGRKCGGGHTVDSLHHHAHDGGEREVGHVLIRHGHSTGIEDLILGSRRTQSEAGLTSDDETSPSPLPRRRTRSEAYTTALSVTSVSPGFREQELPAKRENEPFASDTQEGSVAWDITSENISRDPPMIDPSYSTSTSDIVFPSDHDRPAHIDKSAPPRKYSPPPHIPKPRTGSVSSLLPGIPTPPPSPPPSETLREKMGAAITSAGVSRDHTALAPIAVSGSGSRRSANEISEIGVISDSPFKRKPAASSSVSTLGNQENLSRDVLGDLKSMGIEVGDIGEGGSEASSESSSSMTTGAGGYIGVPWRRGTPGSPGPSELMNLDQKLGMKGGSGVLGVPGLGVGTGLKFDVFDVRSVDEIPASNASVSERGEWGLGLGREGGGDTPEAVAKKSRTQKVGWGRGERNIDT